MTFYVSPLDITKAVWILNLEFPLTWQQRALIYGQWLFVPPALENVIPVQLTRGITWVGALLKTPHCQLGYGRNMTNNTTFGKGIWGRKHQHYLSKWPRTGILVSPGVGREEDPVLSETLSSLCTSDGSTLSRLHFSCVQSQ